MLAFIFSILIFLSCFSVGFQVLRRTKFSNDKILTILVSPVIGLGLLVILLNLFSRLGVPVKEISWPLLGLVSVCVFLTFREVFSPKGFRKNLKYLLIIPLLTLFGAWPMLKFGFHWLSYMNDDMNTYVLGATRLFTRGFYSRPDPSLFLGTDYSQAYYHFYVITGVRSGSELFLAFLSSFHHGNVIQTFMPTIVALQMVLVASTVALVRASLGTNRWKTISAYFLVIILPLVNLGFLYQLIGQVGGLSIGIAIVIFFTNFIRKSREKREINSYIVLSILISAQLLWYPEIILFLSLPLTIYAFLIKKVMRNRLILTTLYSTLISSVILNKYFFQALHFSFIQISSTTNVNSANKLTLFPYFLKPEGLAAIAGFSPLNKPFSQSVQSLFVLASFILLIMLVVVPFIKPRTPNPFAIVFLVMFAALIYLIQSSNGFGSYKLAMYLQPFMVCCVILLGSRIHTHIKFNKFRSWIFGLPLLSLSLVFGLLLVFTSQFYVSASTGNVNKGFVEIPEVSSSNLVDQILRAEKSYDPTLGPIFSPSPLLSLEHLEAITSRGIPLVFISRDPISGIKSPQPKILTPTSRQVASFGSGKASNKFEQLTILSTKVKSSRWYLLSNDRFSSLNKTTYSVSGKSWNYRLVENPSDYLVFVNSSQAPIYDDYLGSLNQTALFPAEPNPMVPGSYMQSIGDSLLIQVLDFQPGSYLRFDVSSTVLSQYLRRIPIITVFGSNRVEIRPVGSGSARISTDHIVPLRINNQDYIEVKFDQKLKLLPNRSSGMARIYGSQVILDSRKISTFLSDLSLIDPRSPLTANIPSQVGSFPRDLENSGLNYSGAYEDGWMSPSFYFELKSKGSSNLNISGFVPLVGSNRHFRTSVSAYIDGVEAESFTLGIGNFNQNIRSKVVLVPGTIHRVEFRFKKFQILPEPDGRPASVFLTNLGFK